MRKKSLAQQAADTIYKLICTGVEFSPGSQLPGENDLSNRLGISRNTLREAIRILASQGILDVYRGKGTFVSTEVKKIRDIQFAPIEQVRLHLKDLYEARLLFEPEMAAIACRRATDREIEQIMELGKLVENTIRRNEDRTSVDQEFHNAIVTASHNEFMQRLVPIINSAVEQTIRIDTSVQTLADNTLIDHSLLMGFLWKRDANGAKQAMSIHLHHAIDTLGLNNGDDPIF